MDTANIKDLQLHISTLDIEASGIHSNSYPIEIGISLQDGTSWCSLIKPDNSWQHWDKTAEAIHGITREELIRFGKSPREVAITLNQLINTNTIYSDCWVLDKPWLTRLYEAAGVSISFKLLDMMHVMKEDNYEQLLDTKNTIASNLNIRRHRATNDAKILQLAYEKIINNK